MSSNFQPYNLSILDFKELTFYYRNVFRKLIIYPYWILKILTVVAVDVLMPYNLSILDFKA